MAAHLYHGKVTMLVLSLSKKDRELISKLLPSSTEMTFKCFKYLFNIILPHEFPKVVH